MADEHIDKECFLGLFPFFGYNTNGDRSSSQSITKQHSGGSRVSMRAV